MKYIVIVLLLIVVSPKIELNSEIVKWESTNEARGWKHIFYANGRSTGYQTYCGPEGIAIYARNKGKGFEKIQIYPDEGTVVTVTDMNGEAYGLTHMKRRAEVNFWD